MLELPANNPFPDIRQRLNDRLLEMDKDEPDLSSDYRAYLEVIKSYPYVPLEVLVAKFSGTYQDVFKLYVNKLFQSIVDLSESITRVNPTNCTYVPEPSFGWRYIIETPSDSYAAIINATIHDDLNFRRVDQELPTQSPRYWLKLKVWLKFGQLTLHQDNHSDLVVQSMLFIKALQLCTESRQIQLSYPTEPTLAELQRAIRRTDLDCWIQEEAPPRQDEPAKRYLNFHSDYP